ncbi:PREDICTED: uncharacterized protein LOC109470863 [Branchiostoma belcheri]|uniref:Uncharacterized protein LOC109470863 n=1 Tax=Branchiostoma belcheri TaxID=7741 RepID=A0A6P4Z361_BRABE|nr:PREDICTED: uncharacterized protein LOC109470863 [Branchiostoma belcheri]
MKARVLSWKVDYEGHRILLKVVGASGLAGCDKDHAKGIKPAGVNRTIFPLQRCYLAQDSDLRRNRNGRYLRINDNGQVEGHSGPDNSNPPAPRTHDKMVATGQQVEALRLQGRRAQADRLQKETGVRGVSEICRLPYVDIVADVPVDPMHVIAGFCKKLLAIMRADSSVDGYNIRQFERQMGRFHANIMPAAEGQDLPQAPWTLTPAQLRLADECLACIKGITGHSFRPDMSMFVDGGANQKSEEVIHAMTNGPVKFCLRGFLGNLQRTAIFAYCDAVYDVLQSSSRDMLDDCQEQLCRAMVLLARTLPCTIQTMLFHLHYHLVEGVQRFGTAQSFWMFPAERRHHLFKQLIKSPKHPETSIMNRFKYVLAAQRLRHNGEVPVDLVDIFQQYDKVDDFERGYNTRRRRNEDENDYEDIVVHGAGCHLSFSSFAQRLGANSAGSFGMFFGTPREMVLNEADRQLLQDEDDVDGEGGEDEDGEGGSQGQRVVFSNEVGGSYHMEQEGLRRSLEKMEDFMEVGTLVTLLSSTSFTSGMLAKTQSKMYGRGRQQ